MKPAMRFSEEDTNSSFQFSQACLQDFVDCKRRFFLRYVERVAWPAIESEPAKEWEEHVRAGEQFHRLVQQSYSGVPELALDRLVAEIGRQDSGSPLVDWWREFSLHKPDDLPADIRSEITLSIPFMGRRLSAKYDLLAIDPGKRVVIVDWKTSQNKPKITTLEKRIQTLVYRYVIVEMGNRLPGGKAIQPHQVEMMYWYPAFPEDPVVIQYDAEQHRRAGEELTRLAQMIQSLEDAEFTLTADDKKCVFCVYRSLCDRGIQAGEMGDGDGLDGAEDGSIGFDVDQVDEIAF